MKYLLYLIPLTIIAVVSSLSAESKGNSEIPIVNVNKVIWQKCNIGESGESCEGVAKKLDYENAIQACNDLGNESSKNLWRLPSIDELRSLIKCDMQGTPEYRARCSSYTKGIPTANLELFPSLKPNFYWSGTLRKGNEFYALFVDFKDGFSNYNVKTILKHVKCVRNQKN